MSIFSPKAMDFVRGFVCCEESVPRVDDVLGVRVCGGPHEVRVMCSLEERPGNPAVLSVDPFHTAVEPVDVGRGDCLLDFVQGQPVSQVAGPVFGSAVAVDVAQGRVVFLVDAVAKLPDSVGGVGLRF